MCGIAGFHYLSENCPPQAIAHLTAMSEAMAHRGPDGRGTLIDGPTALAHRRLAIIDVDGGQQPMTSATGGVHVIYNGEIYNFQSLRSELADYPFRTKLRHGSFARCLRAMGSRVSRPAQWNLCLRHLGCARGGGCYWLATH